MTPASSVQDMNGSEEKALGQAFAKERAVSHIWVNEQAGKWARKKLITSGLASQSKKIVTPQHPRHLQF